MPEQCIFLSTVGFSPRRDGRYKTTLITLLELQAGYETQKNKKTSTFSTRKAQRELALVQAGLPPLHLSLSNV